MMIEKTAAQPKGRAAVFFLTNPCFAGIGWT
jgi:hypothetical protein